MAATGASPPDDPGSDATLLGEILDVTSLQILATASGRVVTVRELSVELGIPLASLYRRVRALQASNALAAARTRDGATGKDVLAYTNRVGSIRVDLARSPPTVEMTLLKPPTGAAKLAPAFPVVVPGALGENGARAGGPFGRSGPRSTY